MMQRKSILLCSLAVVLLSGPLGAQQESELENAQDTNAAAVAQPATPEPATPAAATPEPGPDPVQAELAEEVDLTWPLLSLAVGVATVLGLIIALKVNAFIALITAAIIVSLMAPGPWSDKIARVAEAFGSAAGRIGIVIALAAVIGTCLLDSGAADRIVRAFLRLLGERRAPIALMGSGYVLAVPVFFDTVFYLLVPLARSLHRTTGKQYLKYILAIGAGGAITHTLVPPTPGPLVMAATLGFDVGVMILVGGLIAIPSAIAGLIFAGLIDRWMPIPMRPLAGQAERPPLTDSQLPPLWMAVAPVVLPVLLISTNTVLETVAKKAIRSELAAQGTLLASEAEVEALLREPDRLASSSARELAEWVGTTRLFGNANLALLVSTIVAMGMLVRQRGLSRTEVAEVVENSLMSGGVIILITAGGGAFGAMLQQAQVGLAIESLFAEAGGTGTILLVVGFAVAAVLKVAQGSGTVAMITGSAMLAGIASPEALGFHPVYLATAIGGGSMVGSWMNDSGFWIFAKMGGLSEVEALKSWTLLLVVLGLVSFLTTLLLANLLPLV